LPEEIEPQALLQYSLLLFLLSALSIWRLTDMNYVEKVRSQLRIELEGLDKELLELYTLLGVMLGTEVAKDYVHDAWSVWQNRKNPEHKSLVPFEELSPQIQDLDTKYVEAIIRAVKKAQALK
jgi:hypothetical protein